MSEGKNLVVCGQTRSGKSYFVKQLIESEQRLLIYLPKRDEKDYPGVMFDGLAGERDLMLRWWKYTDQRCGRWRLVYRPRDIFDVEEFDKICTLAYKAGACTVVAEDIMTYATERNIGQGFKTLLTAGNSRGCSVIAMTQRPYRIPVEVTSQAREVYLFRSFHEQDMAFIRNTWGQDAAAKVDTLKQYEHVTWNDSGQVDKGKASA